MVSDGGKEVRKWFSYASDDGLCTSFAAAWDARKLRPLLSRGANKVQGNESGVDGGAAGAGVPGELADQLAAIERALAPLADLSLDIEIHREAASGRGARGGWEWLEDYPLDGEPIVDALAAIRRRLRDVHGGGAFRLIVRDPAKPGQWLLNQGLRIKRTDVQPTQPRQDESGLAALLVKLDENAARRAEESERRFAALVERLAQPAAQAGGLEQQLDLLVKVKAAFGSPDAKASDPLEMLDRVLSIRDKVTAITGDGASDPWAKLAGDYAPEVLGLLRDMVAGGEEDEGEEPETEQPESELANRLESFTGQMLKAARMNVDPATAARVALGAVKRPAALVRFCAKPNAAGLLCEASPELVRFAGWVERVRVEVVKQGRKALPKPAAAPVAAEEGKPGGDEAGKDAKRAGRDAGNAAADAGTGGAGKAARNRARPGGKADGQPSTEGLPRRGRGATRVRS